MSEPDVNARNMEDLEITELASDDLNREPPSGYETRPRSGDANTLGSSKVNLLVRGEGSSGNGESDTGSQDGLSESVQKTVITTVFTEESHVIRNGEVVDLTNPGDSMLGVGGLADMPRRSVAIVEEPAEEEAVHQRVFTKFTIFRIIIMTSVMLVGSILFAIIETHHDQALEKRPHGGRAYATMQGDPAVVPVHEGRHAFVQMDVYIIAPQQPGNITIQLQQQVAKDGPWTDVGSSWSMTVNAGAEYFLKSKRLEGPAKAPHYLRVIAAGSFALPQALTIKAHPLNGVAAYEELIAGIILIVVYTLIIFELIPRCLVAMVGSFVALITYSLIHERPNLEYVVTWIDYETVILLFGMMVMVQILSSTGAFERVTLHAIHYSKGDPWRTIVIIGLGVAFTSAFLDNVTCMLLLTPVCIKLCQVLGLEPQPVLIAAAILSNIGGAATGVGDPPNIIVLNYGGVVDAGVGFAEFSLHMSIGAIIAGVVAIFQLKFMYRHWIRSSRGKQQGGRDSFCVNMPTVTPKTLVKARSTATGVRYRTRNLHLEVNKVGMSRVRDSIRNAIVVHMAHFQDKLEEILPTHQQIPGEIDMTVLNTQYQIKDRLLLYNCMVILVIVVLLFFLASVLHLHLNLPWVAILGFMTLVLLSDIHEFEGILETVEWGTLLFFAALFVLMHALEKLGLIVWIGDQVVAMVETAPAEHRLTVAIVLLLWVSGIASAFVDNIPYTAAMCPVIIQMAADLDIPVKPLVWTLATGACLGGNGTLIGASANVVTAGLSQQAGYPISFNLWFKSGFPVMIGSMVTMTVVLLILHPGLGWNVP